MQGLVKLAAFTAPVMVLVIALSFYLNREHSAKMDMESAAFDRDWYRFEQKIADSDEEKAELKKLTSVAQSKYSSAKVELEQHKQQADQAGREMNEALKDIDQKLREKAGN